MTWDEIQAGIFAGESGGDYNALYGYSNRDGGAFSGVNLTDMTIDEALAFADPSGEYGQWVKGEVGRVATPMGAYQVVGTTLRDAKNALGLTGNEKMTPELQDAIGQWVLATQGTGAWEGYQGPQAAPDAQNALAAAIPPEQPQNALWSPSYTGLDPAAFQSQPNALPQYGYDRETNPLLRFL